MADEYPNLKALLAARGKTRESMKNEELDELEKKKRRQLQLQQSSLKESSDREINKLNQFSGKSLHTKNAERYADEYGDKAVELAKKKRQLREED